MSISDDDILQAISETFRVEADEHIQSINRHLLRLEQGAVENLKATLDEIAREAHTLKGASSILGLEVIQATAHAMEEVFDALRDADRQAPADLYDLLYDALDRLSEACRLVVDPTGADAVTLEALQEACHRYALEAASGVSSATIPTKAPAPDPPPAVSTDSQEDDVSFDSVVALPPPEPIDFARVEPAASDPTRAGEETIRVPIRKLDSLMAQIGELLIARIRNEERMTILRELQVELEDANKVWSRFKEVRRAIEKATGRRRRTLDAKRQELVDRMDAHLKGVSSRSGVLRNQFARDAMHVSILVDNLQEDIKKARMLPVSTILDGFHRLVRDVARKEGKQATLDLVGTETEVDKRVLELIKDPLMHLLRNAVSHGIETPGERERLGKAACGTVAVETHQAGGRIVISIADDGRGIDARRVAERAIALGLLDAAQARALAERDLLQFIFHSGLSTKETVTDVSGRGVGMDVVRENIQRVGGQIDIDTRAGRGTRISVTLPLTLSTTNSLLVESSGQTFAIPIGSVERILRIVPEDVETIEETPALRVDGAPVAIAFLSDVLALPPGQSSDETKLPVVLLNVDGRRLGLVVDALVDERELVVKPLGKQLLRVRFVSGGTIVGSGAVLLVLNPHDLVRSHTAKSASPDVVERFRQRGERTTGARRRILLVEDSITTRTLEKNILEMAGYEVAACKDGIEALAYLRLHECDAVITDVNMPSMDGFVLVERLRQDARYQDLPVLLVTSLASDDDRRRGMQVGANAYLVKSDFEQGRFLEMLAALL